jgi:hypothetical protein
MQRGFRVLAGTLLAISLASGQTIRKEEPNPAATSRAIQQRANMPARINEFKAQPSSIQPGQMAMLVWSVENPNSVTIDPEPGKVTARGSRAVKPAATTIYTLTVNGNQGIETRTVTVNVAGTTAITSAATKATAVKKDVPRMPDGKPSLAGVWDGGQGPAQGLQLKAGAEKFKVVRGPKDSGLYADCMPTGVPQAFGVPYQWEIVQGVDRLVILHEYPHLFRIIPTDGRPHPVDPDPTWMGDSVGHWEGDTLVVDTIGFNDKTELPGGYRHTESLHVVERFTRKTADAIEYQATVEDPNVFEKPWTMARTFPARTDLEKISEFVCENNRDYGKLFAK